jgi:hypothetical protein
VRLSEKRYYEQLAFRNALIDYFAKITGHHEEVQRRASPSTSPRDVYERFKPVFDEVFNLVNHEESGRMSHKLNVRQLAKLMDEFSEMLISSASFTQKELSAFWAEDDHSESTTRIDSARLKRMGARTLSAIVEVAASSQQRPHRSRRRRPGINHRLVP